MAGVEHARHGVEIGIVSAIVIVTVPESDSFDSCQLFKGLEEVAWRVGILFQQLDVVLRTGVTIDQLRLCT